MRRFFYIILFIISFIWQLPQNIVALFMLPFLGKLTLIASDHLNLCFIGTKMSGGISLGNFSFVSPVCAKRSANIKHEHIGHAKQSWLLGPLYLFVIGIPSIIHTGHKNCPCYYHFYTENIANRLAGLYVETSPSGTWCLLREK